MLSLLRNLEEVINVEDITDISINIKSGTLACYADIIYILTYNDDPESAMNLHAYMDKGDTLIIGSIEQYPNLRTIKINKEEGLDINVETCTKEIKDLKLNINIQYRD